MMTESAKFTDADGREWPVEISVAALKRMRLLADGFKLDDILPKSSKETDRDVILSRYQDFLDDDLKFAAVLWAIVKPHADALGITQEQFDEALRGDANRRAIRAFHEAFTDFSTPQQKPLLLGIRVLMDKREKLTEIATKRVNSEAAKIDDAALESFVDDAIGQASNANAGNLAAS